MNSSVPALAAFVWFVVYLGYVLLAGMGTFWAVVWPDGHTVRRLRLVAVAGLALLGFGTVAEALLERLASGRTLDVGVEVGSGAWLLVRLAVLAVVGFFGVELLRRPVRGGRRVAVLGLVVALTITLVVESAAMAAPRVVAITASAGIYLLALAAWLGGLVALAALLVPRHRPSGLEQVWSRFSWFAGSSAMP